MGTEEANILTFRLPTSITGKGVGRYTEEVRASHASHGEGKEGEMENAFASKYGDGSTAFHCHIISVFVFFFLKNTSECFGGLRSYMDGLL